MAWLLTRIALVQENWCTAGHHESLLLFLLPINPILDYDLHPALTESPPYRFACHGDGEGNVDQESVADRAYFT
ncbi:hypothetical protein J6590_039569 [Homalodisca vitripennis]|nr:hypothetical protein J6590_039569 [Homalodisca vitripennis]